LLLQADTVCFTLQRYLSEIRRRYGACNLAHIPVGAFDPPELLPALNSRPDVLMFATFAPYKGLPIMLDAFDQVWRREPAAGLTVAGGDHPRFPGYLERIRAGHPDRRGVRWLGPLAEPDLRAVFAASSLVVLPHTATTGASSVIHRAAAFGRPVIVSDLPDTRALAVEEGLWLEFVPPGDHGALAAAMISLLADHPRREAMACHNLAAMQKMTLADTCTAYISLFNQAIGRSFPSGVS
jgi:glycosyltransferase involved in cell wall biosynthesis